MSKVEDSNTNSSNTIASLKVMALLSLSKAVQQDFKTLATNLYRLVKANVITDSEGESLYNLAQANSNSNLIAIKELAEAEAAMVCNCPACTAKREVATAIQKAQEQSANDQDTKH